MKKLTTKLLIAALSVALALASLGTSTYAWFSMNKTVEASSLQVQAVTVENLFIIENFKTTSHYKEVTKLSIELDSTTRTLYPIALSSAADAYTAVSSGAKADKFYFVAPLTWDDAEGKTSPTATNKGDVKTYDTAASLNGTETIASIFVDESTPAKVDFTVDPATTGSGINYSVTPGADVALMVNHDEMTIVKQSADSTNTADYKATVTISGLSAHTTDSDIYKALNVSFYVSTGDGAAGTWYLYNEEVGATSILDGVITMPALTIASAVADNTCIQIVMFVWYNGESANCVNNNSLKAETLSVKVVYSYENN